MKRKIFELKDSNINLVYIDEKSNTPHCKIHGAMNKVTDTGIWRCIRAISLKTGKCEDDCRAGCQETEWKGKNEN